MRGSWTAAGLAFLLAPRAAFGAIGCTLSNPAQDLKYLFPEMTSYRENLLEFTKKADGRELFKALSARLGGDLDPIYETYETPYTLYAVFKGKEKLGLVHGVNVPGKGGVIQVFLWVDPKTARIKRFFYQRLESPAAKELRKKEFRAQFEGLSLADFDDGKAGSLRPPRGAGPDYAATLRGIRKNLALLDLFVFGGKP